MADFDLRVDELVLLEDAARTLDLIERMQAVIDEAPLTVPGSREQVTTHPLLLEVRQHRMLLARLLGQLKLPEEPDAAWQKAIDRRHNARGAVLARWQRPPSA